MAELISRVLRDGALEGELAPALTIKDSIASPFGFDVFAHVLAQLSTNVLAGKSQSQGVVIIALSQSPSYYVDLLKRRGVDVALPHKWIRILDCYTDPLGWNDQFMKGGDHVYFPQEVSAICDICKNLRDMDKLSSSIFKLGKELVGQGKLRFSVAIDSVNEMLRHSSATSVAGLLSNIRSHDQVSSVFWLSHVDLHEERVTAMLEYMSSIVASTEPFNQLANGHSLLEYNSRKGKFHVRFKRRNGRVRVMSEEYQIEQSDIKFNAISSGEAIINQGIVPKVQFNLQLSEKERVDRAKVILPFEHQGNGESIQIYDGRRSLPSEIEDVALNSGKEDNSKGEIIYFRDSDGEMPDSDEDPDDDLDI